MKACTRFQRNELLSNAGIFGRDFHEKFKKFLDAIPVIQTPQKREEIIKFLYWCTNNNMEVPDLPDASLLFIAALTTIARALKSFT